MNQRKHFEGWYFKHQKGGRTLAFIPGRAESGAFVQVITNDAALQFDVPELQTGDTIRTDGCSFGPSGVTVDLPGVRGSISYGPLHNISGDIMGPFRFFPMECRHGIVSMLHSLEGSMEINGERLDFDGGTGYIESDSGTSFPSEYLWLQCNDFHTPVPCSVMAAVARIPFAGIQFTGCICAVMIGKEEYRLATYRGARVTAAGPKLLCVKQGNTELRVEIENGKGHALKSPVNGAMSGRIRECNNATARFRLFRHGNLLFDQTSGSVSFECELDGSRSRILRT